MPEHPDTLIWVAGVKPALEIIEVEKYVIRRSATRWLGRKLLTRETIARAYVAKAFCGYPITRDLVRALQSSVSLRLICGFEALGDIPSKAPFPGHSRSFLKALSENVSMMPWYKTILPMK